MVDVKVNGRMLCSAKFSLEFFLPWIDTNLIVCADDHFASVTAVEWTTWHFYFMVVHVVRTKKILIFIAKYEFLTLTIRGSYFQV